MTPLWISFSAITFLILMRMSFLRTVGRSEADGSFLPKDRNDRIALFVIAFLVTMSGFLLQFSIEMMIPTRDATRILKELKSSNGHFFEFYVLQGFISPLIPASIAAYVVTETKGNLNRMFKGTLALFISLSGTDLFATVEGSCSYRGFLFSIICNIVGAPFGAALILILQSKLRPVWTPKLKVVAES